MLTFGIGFESLLEAKSRQFSFTNQIGPPISSKSDGQIPIRIGILDLLTDFFKTLSILCFHTIQLTMSRVMSKLTVSQMVGEFNNKQPEP